MPRMSKRYIVCVEDPAPIALTLRDGTKCAASTKARASALMARYIREWRERGRRGKYSAVRIGKPTDARWLLSLNRIGTAYIVVRELPS